jgi:hypothetical protein
VITPRSLLAIVCCLACVAFAVSRIPATTVGAQDTTDDRIAALETQVAELEETVERQGRRLSQLTDHTPSPGDARAGDDDQLPQQPADPTPTASTPADDTLGTRANPIPIGDAARIGDWSIAVQRVAPEGTEAVLAENQFNDPPQDGRQFFLINLAATFSGANSGSVLGDLRFQAVGESNVAYTTYDPSCGVVPNELDFTEVFSGGTIEGNICFQIESGDEQSLLLYIEPGFSLEEERIWFALTN